jgi:hypothetical protein
MTNQLKAISIKSLYPLALAEGEGVGTAYEYFAKRLALGRWLPGRSLKGPVLIAGLPEKYGASLDFLLLAEELGRPVTVVDERPSALQKAKDALAAAQELGHLKAIRPTYIQVESVSQMAEVAGSFSLVISSEVLQRINAENRPRYWQRLRELGEQTAVFAPNAGNPAHTNLSGLAGVSLAELRTIAGAAAQTNYIDMPPFPPGMTRTDDQREQATSGTAEAIAMWGLGWYARLERFLPAPIRRSQAHIVFALSR